MENVSPSNHRECLLRFRSEHQAKTLAAGGMIWEYYACGRGKATLLLLAGGLRIAESAFLYIQMFEDSLRVIAPTYPPIRSIDRLVEGIAAILDAEGATSVFVLGQSYGGMAAQVFVQRYPERVKSLVLSSAGPLAATPAQAGLLALLRRLAQLLPEQAGKALYKSVLWQVISVPAAELDFWKDYLDELFARRLSKADVLSHFFTSEDALKKYAYRKASIPAWAGPVLIIGGEKDPTSTEADRRAMAAYYPQARVVVLPGLGHTVAWQQPGAYRREVLAFLAG